MTGCIVLGDSTVHEILINLTTPEILLFHDQIVNSLLDFSVGGERSYQPSPSVVVRPNGQKSLFRPFTSASSVGAKIIVDPAAKSTSANDKSGGPTLHGILVVCDEDGIPTGIINADEITGYRTSLMAIIPYLWRRETAHIVVFGAGKQALWHLRLALALRGSEISSITIVNRSKARAQVLLSTLQSENQTRWKSTCTMDCLETTAADYDQTLGGVLSRANVIFCTVPSQQPLFPAQYVTEREDRANTGPYISAIGSWQADMIEVDPTIMQYAVGPDQGFNSTGGPGGTILVDDRENALANAGEIVQSQLKAEHMIEVGELLQFQSDTPSGPQKERCTKWMEEGLLVYKSVGVSVTDLAAGNALLDLAKEKSMGEPLHTL
ncbi:hypothetical protein FE257_006263 [Aspergillus nanangensis]|uniref:Quinate/shikimate 5-dehydrogenase/glutamyl-tRNA reductase domain-containing protein n=1 Tax=Aspergillus nanangensis TaxID=2582783 RepID=A0AAD4CQX2_ASPNN|nr:hypothetical protein FE257_006263 [Aspergillus nanangensis]